MESACGKEALCLSAGYICVAILLSNLVKIFLIVLFLGLKLIAAVLVLQIHFQFFECAKGIIL